MSNHLWQRLGAASGIVYVVLLPPRSSIGGPDIQIVFLMEILAFLFFLFFLGNLWSALRGAEGGSEWLSATAFGAGLMSVTIKVASAAPVLAARYRTGNGLDPQLARTLQDINDASFYLSFFPLAVLLAAFAIVVIPIGRSSKMARLDCGSSRPGVHRRWDVRERQSPVRVGGNSDDSVYALGYHGERRLDPAYRCVPIGGKQCCCDAAFGRIIREKVIRQKGVCLNMIRKILKWIVIVLGSLVERLVLVFAILYMIGGARWNRIRWNYDFSFDS